MASKKNPAKKQPVTPQAKAVPKGKNPGSIRSSIQTPSQPWYLIPACIFLLCFLLYGNSINHGYVLDDDIYTQKNVYVQEGFSHIKDIFNKGSLYGFNKVNESNYRPLVLLNFMIEVQWFGLNPHVSHFFNVFFFAICCILLYYLLLKLFKEYNALIPLAATLLFMCHPIHTEAVANIKSRDEILGFMFGILSFYYIIKYAESEEIGHYIISLVAFFCSALSKENALTYVLVIPLLLYFFTSVDLKKVLLLTLPYVAIIGVYIVIRNSVLSSVTFNKPLEVINNALMSTHSVSDRLATEIMMMGKYVFMLFIPYPLSWDYSYNQIPIVSFTNVSVISSILLYAGLAWVVIKSMKLRFTFQWQAIIEQLNEARNSEPAAIYTFSILFYIITIFLSSNLLVKIGSTFAERFLFVPSLGFCMSVPLLCTRLLKLNPHNAIWQNKTSFYGVIGLILVVFAGILISRNNDWKDDYTLFQSGVVSAPNSTRTHDALAREYRTQAELTNDITQKKQFYNSSLQEFHKSIAIYDKSADVYYNMGVSYYESGMPDSALIVYKKAVAVDSNYTLAYNNLGVLSFNKKQFGDAIGYFTRSYKADTNNVQALANIGAAYQNSGNGEKALYYYTKGLSKDANNAMIRGNLANMYVAGGMQDFNNKNYDRAMEQFMAALKYNPNSPDALGNIGAVYQSKGDNAKAVEYYQKALAIDPKNEVFSRNLSMINGIKK
jgi:tetratricopeptide (TPR) repeat protein